MEEAIAPLPEDAQLKMMEFERKAIQENMIVDQHIASLIDEQKEQENTKPGYLKIHRLMKLIASGGKNTTNYHNRLVLESIVKYDIL